jgi:purine-binding chemotaxis protein CheW
MAAYTPVHHRPAELALTSEGAAADLVSMCSLRAGNNLFGIETSAIREVLEQRTIYPIPLVPPCIAGMFSYRGEILTAVNLRGLLGLPPASCTGCVLVLDGDQDEERFGLLADSVEGVLTLERRTSSPNPSTLDEASRAILRCSYRTADGRLGQLDPQHLTPSHIAATGLFCRGSAHKIHVPRPGFKDHGAI